MCLAQNVHNHLLFTEFAQSKKMVFFIMKTRDEVIKLLGTPTLKVLFQEQLFRPLSGSHQAVMTDYYSVMNDRAPARHRYPRYSCSFL